MEPLTTAAIAIGTVLATKALERTGEIIGETLWDKTSKFLVTLRKHSPQTVVAIEKASDEPLDYGKAVIDVETATQAHPEVKQAVQELAAAAEVNPPKNLAQILEEIKATIEKSQHPFPTTFNQNIQKAVNAAQNQTIDQRGSSFNF
ncbi:hypothetical protein ACN23B_13970 [Anabaena sp. FACHB-709]|uniref:Uncharacterized protein n=2 Tax=Nostocaceae TaxID=1162 RepID=A0A1Z4KHG6_ANAVA|nr:MULTISPECIES: hypothetical protein [Nostocaceae]BAY68412.1 hypothetical protein NIES23_11980 [Trichormus variabilis NIES-23]HBW32696.1 hypothetical protein [Nostoc sp. UBA8866]MBD2171778.1 hypothetical protein [Anabaena cylindrica FACHB-318]MBD2264296.1 hypothetical protein [Anabaena sp. FACHB-709]MBD2273639.1 hypothetical protein [Nostoc sp. PCC 7120 = FACHB-418]